MKYFPYLLPLVLLLVQYGHFRTVLDDYRVRNSRDLEVLSERMREDKIPIETREYIRSVAQSAAANADNLFSSWSTTQISYQGMSFIAFYFFVLLVIEAKSKKEERE